MKKINNDKIVATVSAVVLAVFAGKGIMEVISASPTVSYMFAGVIVAGSLYNLSRLL